MRLISLDFETFYSPSYGLKKLTTEEYIMGEEFEVIGVSIKVGEDLAKWYTGTHAELKEILGGYKLETAAVLAHNCAFDAFILSQIFGIYPAKYLDTLSMARALHGVSVGGSLAALVKQYGLGEKGIEVVNALGKHRKDFTPTEMAAYAGYCINDTELCYALFKVLVKKFNIMELEVIHLTIRMWVVPLLELDISSAEEYLVDVRAKKQALLDSIVDSKEVLMSNPRFANALEALGVEVPLKISPTTGKQAYAFAKTDDGLKALMEHPDIRVQALVAARLGLKSTIEETRAERYIGIAKRMGVIPVPLSYYGASTGRFTAAGGQKVNYQNIPRDSSLKESIKAPYGYTIVGADLSNIELRVGLWLAGELDALNILGQGGDLYKEFASMAFNVPYEEVTKTQRFIGKTCQLGLLYGVGAAKLQTSIKAGAQLDIGLDEATRIVNLYRDTYTGITGIWKRCGEAIIAMMNNNYYEFGPEGFFQTHGSAGVLLPSGMYMQYANLGRYPDPDTGKSEVKYKLRNGYDKLYPGKLFNNCTQATARCIMTEAMVRVGKRYPIVLTIHDALYILCPDDGASVEEAKKFLIDEMCRTPLWMPGIPLAAEGKSGKSLAEC